MTTGIRGVVRGFWQGAKKLGRAWSAASFSVPNNIRENSQEEQRDTQEKQRGCQGELRDSREDQGAKSLREKTAWLEASAASLRERLGGESYCQLPPVFTEMPFIRPMGHNTQLPNTIRYIDMNPLRLATKRQKPGFFCVQRNIVIGERSYDGVGNTMLLMAEKMAVVHVRSALVKAAERGDVEPLRNYKNSCVLAARKGAVMLSPFISPHEKQVMQVLLDEQWPFICLTDNGFRDFYKPSDTLFDACAAGRVLILSPWQYDDNKRHISRADCVALNNLAEEIVQCYLTH